MWRYAHAVILYHQEPTMPRFRPQNHCYPALLCGGKSVFERVGDQFGEDQPTWNCRVDIHATLRLDLVLEGNAAFCAIRLLEFSDQALDVYSDINVGEIFGGIESLMY